MKETIMINKDRDDSNVVEWDEDGCTIHSESRRIVGFYDTLQEACEALGEFAHVRAWTYIGIPRQ
jgi:hypothetical protein